MTDIDSCVIVSSEYISVYGSMAVTHSGHSRALPAGTAHKLTDPFAPAARGGAHFTHNFAHLFPHINPAHCGAAPGVPRAFRAPAFAALLRAIKGPQDLPTENLRGAQGRSVDKTQRGVAVFPDVEVRGKL